MRRHQRTGILERGDLEFNPIGEISLETSTGGQEYDVPGDLGRYYAHVLMVRNGY